MIIFRIQRVSDQSITEDSSEEPRICSMFTNSLTVCNELSSAGELVTVCREPSIVREFVIFCNELSSAGELATVCRELSIVRKFVTFCNELCSAGELEEN